MKTNHVTQVATFEKLLGFCNAHGSVFNPSKKAIKLTALEDLRTQANESMRAVKEAITAKDNAQIARRQTFRELPKFATRIIAALAATDASEEVIEKANAFRHSLSFKANRPALPSSEANPSPGEEGKKRSTSMLSFTRRADSFAALVEVLRAEPSYTPNEESISVAGLTAFVESLRNMNRAVYQAEVDLSNARFKRNRVLYGEDGIYDCSTRVKKYVKSLYGASSTQFRQISGLRFIDKKF